MRLTYRVDRLPPDQRDAILHWGERRGDVVVIDAADLHRAAPPRRCPRCHGPHDVSTCPIDEDADVEQERRRLRQGGCCGSPSRDVD